MITKRNDNRTILHIGAAVAVLLFMAALFVGAGAAISWNSLSATLTSGTYTIDDPDGTQLNSKDRMYLTGDVTIEFDPSRAYTVSSSNKGGLAYWIELQSDTTRLTIKNIHINGGSVSGTDTVAGLISYIAIKSIDNNKVVFENCTISGVTFTSTGYGMGGLICSVGVNCEIRNCTVANCNFHSNSHSIGGLVYSVGENCKHLEVVDCKVVNCDLRGNYNVAGLIGGLGSTNTIIQDCEVANCNIISTKCTDTYYTAGLVGQLLPVNGYYGQPIHNITGCKVSNCNIKAESITGYKSTYPYRDGIGGLIGAMDINVLINCGVRDCTVEDCVISGCVGNCGGIIGGVVPFVANQYQKPQMELSIINNTVCNCLIYSDSSNPTCGGPLGGVIGKFYFVLVSPLICSSNTVERCTIVEKQGDKGVGGIAGIFPNTEATISDNKVFNTCIVSQNGAAAGICPADYKPHKV